MEGVAVVKGGRRESRRIEREDERRGMFLWFED